MLVGVLFYFVYPLLRTFLETILGTLGLGGVMAQYFIGTWIWHCRGAFFPVDVSDYRKTVCPVFTA